MSTIIYIYSSLSTCLPTSTLIRKSYTEPYHQIFSVFDNYAWVFRMKLHRVYIDPGAGYLLRALPMFPLNADHSRFPSPDALREASLQKIKKKKFEDKELTKTAQNVSSFFFFLLTECRIVFQT